MKVFNLSGKEQKLPEIADLHSALIDTVVSDLNRWENVPTSYEIKNRSKLLVDIARRVDKKYGVSCFLITGCESFLIPVLHEGLIKAGYMPVYSLNNKIVYPYIFGGEDEES